MRATTKRFYCRSSLVMLLATAPLTGLAAGGALNVQNFAAFDKSVPVSDAVKAECLLERKIPEYVQSYAKGSFDQINMVDKAGKGKTLTMKIVGISATGGGAWSGAKHITIEGSLRENGKEIGDFVAARYSGGGAFGGYKGTCKILDRCAKTLGKDVAGWLQAPTKNAKLGNAK